MSHRPKTAYLLHRAEVARYAIRYLGLDPYVALAWVVWGKPDISALVAWQRRVA